MATIDELERGGSLDRLRINLRRNEFEERKMYLLPKLRSWISGPMREALPFYDDDIDLAGQARGLFKDFITGKPFVEEEMFWRMTPYQNDVYELKTADIRIFGWFQKRAVFIGVNGDTFERCHMYNLHAGYRDEVIRERDMLDLDEPKYIVGAEASHVFSI